jgi:uncharacterized protein
MSTPFLSSSLENDDATLRRLLTQTRSIAVVGLSDKPDRASFGVAQYLKRSGYRIVPVNPLLSSVLDEPCFADLLSIPFPVDMVNVFRRPEEVPALVDQAIAIGARALWLQLGVIHEEAAHKACAHGLDVVMDRCLKIEHARLYA